MPQQTDQQRQQAIADAGQKPAPSLPSATAPIDASTLSGGTTPFTLPPAPAAPTYDISTLPSITNLLSPAPTAAQGKQDQLESNLETDTAKLGGKSDAQITEEDKAANALGSTTGLSGFTTHLTDINNQLQDLDKQIAAVPLTVGQDYAGRATAQQQGVFANGQTRQLTIKRLGLSAVAQTLQGNIASAQATAARAVDLEFSPVQAEIDYLKQALDDNKDNLSREDQQRAEQLQVALQDRQTQLDQQKQNKSTIYGWVAEAAKNGASALTINSALSLTDPSQALQALGPYLSDPVAKQQALLNLSLTQSEINKNNTTAAAGPQASATQITYGNYAPRLQTADQTINGLTASITKMPTVAFAIGQKLPSYLQGSTLQQYNQAKNNFVSAVLRQESGAAISDSERASYEKQYFPQPGDSADTIAQKAQNRAQVIQSYIKDAGPAYSAPYSSSTSGPPAGADGAAYGFPGYHSDGKQWVPN
jgi:hypothetical protein